jgi:hypothetical protein
MISPTAFRRPVGSFTSGFAGRPGKRTIAACFGFLIVLGFFFGIATPYLHCACKFSDKLSEKIVSLVDETDFVRVTRCLRKTATTRLACIVDRRDRRESSIHTTKSPHLCRMYKECANLGRAREHTPTVDRVIARLRTVAT